MRKSVLYCFAIVVLGLTASVGQAYNWRPIIFFDHDRPYASEVFPDLTNASAIADEVAEIYRLHKVTRVELAGHADFTEAEDVELSARRVRAVQSLLIQRGVPPEIIVVRFWGSARPVVPPVLLTPEPQNRRVEISFY